jgi:proline iminopeptidase
MTLRLQITGQGPPLLLLHGGPGQADDLEELATLLHGWQVIRFDQRGWPATPDGPFTLDQLLDDIEVRRGSLGLDRWVVAGHSWGADLALAYALTHSQQVRGLLHLCGTGLQNDRDWKAAYERDRQTEPAPIIPVREDVQRSYLTSWRDWTKGPAVLRRAAECPVPALFVVGEHDPRPAWPNAQLAHWLPQGQLAIIPDAACRPREDQPALLSQTLLPWLAALT